jgi:hypothetical protein
LLLLLLLLQVASIQILGGGRRQRIAADQHSQFCDRACNRASCSRAGLGGVVWCY